MLSYFLVHCMVYCMESKADVVPMEPIIVKAFFLDEETLVKLEHIKEVKLAHVALYLNWHDFSPP